MDMEICCENATQQNSSSTGESGGGILPMIDLAWSPANLLLGAAAGFGIQQTFSFRFQTVRLYYIICEGEHF